MVDYIDRHRDEFGVEPICEVLQLAPSTYYAARQRRVKPSARARRDGVMMQLLMVLWVTNRKVYGSHKLWKAAVRAGHDIGRDQVARLMRELFRWIVGWRVAAHMRTEMVLDALEMARVARSGRRLVGLVAHSDAGSQSTSVRFTERLDELGARPSIGTVADAPRLGQRYSMSSTTRVSATMAT